MDAFSEFLKDLALDPDGLRRQFMSLSAFVNILYACFMGFLVLAVYRLSSSHSMRDRNLTLIIPVLTVLMAVIMRIEGAQAVIFFGIFGILSIVRFRSNLTDQRGITFILFAVIEGLLAGINAYLMALIAWVAVTATILLARKLFNSRLVVRLSVRTEDFPDEARTALEGWFGSKGLETVFLSSSMASDGREKAAGKPLKVTLEYELLPRSDRELHEVLRDFNDFTRRQGYSCRLRRLVD